jgi:hypothetical protein
MERNELKELARFALMMARINSMGGPVGLLKKAEEAGMLHKEEFPWLENFYFASYYSVRENLENLIACCEEEK